MSALEDVEWIRREGEGPPLVLIHGAGANAGVYAPLLAALDGFDAIAVSLPGRGASVGPPRDDASAAAAWLDPRIEALGGPPPIVLGHSYGGGVAIELALRRPVGGLVLVASGARLRVHPSILALAEAAVASGAPMPSRFAFSPDAPREAIDAYEAACRTTPPEATLADWRACDAFDAMARLGDLRAPALVMGGTADTLTPPKYQRYLSDAMPRAQLELVEAAGHMLPFEAPARCAATIRAWAAGVTGA